LRQKEEKLEYSIIQD